MSKKYDEFLQYKFGHNNKQPITNFKIFLEFCNRIIKIPNL